MMNEILWLLLLCYFLPNRGEKKKNKSANTLTKLRRGVTRM